MNRCRTLFRNLFFTALLVPLLVSSSAYANHETVVIDGDLTDLITAVNNNLGSSNGGFAAPGALGNIYSVSCSFVNGFDIRNNYALFDFKDADGNYTPDDVTLYLGWEVEGVIGDVDGDGDPSTYTANQNFTCANNGDQAGIGPFEAYKTFIDLDCDMVPDVTICIMNGQIIKDPATALPGAEFMFDGKFLEAKIPNFQDQLPAGAGLCEADLIMTANSQFDGLGEDSTPAFQLRIDPLIELTKTPAVQDACAGQDVSWTIKVKNTGLCDIQQLTLNDTLSAGMTFVSSVPPSTGDSQNRSWIFMDLASGDSIEITLTANITKPCDVETHVNNVTAEGTHDSNCTKGSGVTAMASATVNCRNTPCDVSGDLNVCVGNTKTYSTTVTDPFLRTWSVTSTPADICETMGALDGPSVQVHFTGAGTCTVSLTVQDPLDPKACQETCNQIVTVNPQPPCNINGDFDVCVGNTKTYFTTVNDPTADAALAAGGVGYLLSWSATSTPDAICNFTGATDGPTVEVNFTGAGQCTLKLTVTDPNDPEDCMTMCTQIVDVHPQPPCNINGDFNACVGNRKTYFTTVNPLPDGPYASNGVIYLLSWSATSTPDAICEIVGPTDESTVQVDLTGAGECTLKLVVRDPADPEDCMSMCTQIITIHPQPPCDIDGDLSVCIGATKTYTTTVGAEFDRTWSVTSTPDAICEFVGGNTGGSVQINFTGVGQCTVKLTVTDPDDPIDCMTMCTEIVTVNLQPPCDIDGDFDVCVGNTKTYTTTVGDGYTRTWSVTSTPADICETVGGTTGGSVQVNFTGAGQCTVKLTVVDPADPEDCMSMCTEIIDVHPQPPCNIDGDQNVCVGNTKTYTTMVGDEYTRTWSVTSTPADICEFVGGNTGELVEINFTAAGACTVKLTVVDPNDPEDCMTMCTYIVTVNPQPPCNITGPEEVCVAETQTYSTDVGDTYAKSWSVTSEPADICSVTGPTDGSSIQVNFTGAGQCTVKLVVTVPGDAEDCMSMCTEIVTVEDCGGFACPHTIGFWRQQCAQKGNGSTKVCLTGMQLLWRCVIDATNVIQWKKNDGSFETTMALRALSNANLFTRLCDQLNGPRPMTIRDMTEIQYLGLMLNVCSGALPLNIQISNSFNGTVAEAIAGIENALNTGNNLEYWKTVADEINNRIGVNAEDCVEGDDLFRNLPGCDVESVGSLLLNGTWNPDVLETRAFPNPIQNGAASIFYTVPTNQDNRQVDLVVFDVTGRVVRKLVSETRPAGAYTADWDLTDDGGAPVSAGIFFYRLTVGTEKVTQKIMVLNR